jgi:hypothetical protein
MVTQPPAEAQAWIRGSAPDAIVDFYIPRGNVGLPGLPGPRGPMGPSAIVGSVITTTGPAVPGTPGAQGLPGPKGDPGGLVLGTVLGTADLNTIIIDGIYRHVNGTDVSLARNYPIATGETGILKVSSNWSDSSWLMQEYIPNENGSLGNVVYRRVRHSGTWNPWRAFNATRIDQSAGRVIYQWDDVNKREQLIYGDTGWRDVSAGLTSGWVGGLHIRRIGSILHVSIRSVTPPMASPVGQFYAWPAGFAPDIMGTYITTRPDSSVTLTSLYFNTVGVTHNILSNAWTSGMGSLLGNFSFPVSAAWPTALPGTAYGSIPNV